MRAAARKRLTRIWAQYESQTDRHEKYLVAQKHGIFSEDSPEQFIQDFECPATRALLIDGTWYEYDDFATSVLEDDAFTGREWCKAFAELMESVADDSLLTVLDCHESCVSQECAETYGADTSDEF